MAVAGKPKQNNRRAAWLGFGFIVFMLAGLAVGKQVLGGEPGARCNQDEDVFRCKWGSVCIGRKCYQKCSQDSDCPADWHCGNTDVTVETQTTFTKSERSGTEQICFAPKGSSKK
jgi:hypothetical protein